MNDWSAGQVIRYRAVVSNADQNGAPKRCGKTASSRDAGEPGAGGQWEQLAPTTWKLSPLCPQLSTVNVAHFYFCLFLHVKLGLS